MAHLRIASAADAEPDPRFIADVDELTAVLKGRGIGFFCMFDTEAGLETHASGTLNPDELAGYAARVLASMANGE